MENVESEKLIGFFYDQKPKIVWEHGDDVLRDLKSLTDANGQHLYLLIDPYFPKPRDMSVFNEATLLGYPIYRIEGMKGLSLKYIFKDGTEKIIEFI